ncbi:hypothetical protein [Streptomyces sp. MB09-02B]|uniref:hypothetical protein n=1 Tax=Streptomyces sp. MB09-02B TaxID=3028667 RepID=UPI0029AC1FF5|nr:hypothetical protein [Streptomyces sp. MB09-02B]MDX3641727.1 hypothetical protein [Streptomyces sp. MB09-02B]
MSQPNQPERADTTVTQADIDTLTASHPQLSKNGYGPSTFAPTPVRFGEVQAAYAWIAEQTCEYAGEFEQQLSFSADDTESSRGTVVMSSSNTRGLAVGARAFVAGVTDIRV